jgi:transposase
MSYGIDLRERLVGYVHDGGTKSEASRLFKVSMWCVNDWCNRQDLAPKEYTRTKHRKLDWNAVRADVQAHPDKLLKERAKEFGVACSSLCYAQKRMKLTRKKNLEVSRAQH